MSKASRVGELVNGLVQTLRKTDDHTIRLEYPTTSFHKTRYGHGRPPHAVLKVILSRHRESYRRVLGEVVARTDRLCRIPVQPRLDEPACPNWVNGSIPALDTAVLYTLLATRNPSRYVEVGSGNSTKFARRAVEDAGLTTRILSIDPAPNVDVDAICDEVFRVPLEDLDVSFFDALEPGDFLFVDGTHRCFTNSDVTVVFLDILPRLPAGVYVHFHDIFWPNDYPPEWAERYYSEQYLVAVDLLAPGSTREIVMANAYVSEDPSLLGILDPLWERPEMAGVERYGGSFWICT